MSSRRSARLQKHKEVQPTEEEEEDVPSPRKKPRKNKKKQPAKKTKATKYKAAPIDDENEDFESQPEEEPADVEMCHQEQETIESNIQPKEQETEQTKEVDESGEYRPDWSKLPVEMLEILIGKCSNQIALNETCTKFNKIAVPQALCLDFDRISTEGAFPNIVRAHSIVKLVGKKVRGTEIQFQRALQSSQSSATKLVLGRRLRNVPAPYWDTNWRGRWQLIMPDIRRLGGQLSAVRFQYLLDFFPNINNIEIHGFATAISRATRLELSELPKLTKLCLTGITYQFLTFFRYVRTLQELTLGGYFDRYAARTIQHLIVSQRSLTFLDAGYAMSLQGIYFNTANSLPNLHTMKGIVRGRIIFDIFTLAPNLRHLELEVDHSSRDSVRTLREYLLARNSLSLETLVITGYSGDITEFKANFPLLASNI